MEEQEGNSSTLFSPLSRRMNDPLRLKIHAWKGLVLSVPKRTELVEKESNELGKERALVSSAKVPHRSFKT